MCSHMFGLILVRIEPLDEGWVDQGSELYKKARFARVRARPRCARTYAGVLPDSWCPTLSAPPIGPALPPDSSRWSPFIVCMYVCMHVCIARKFFTAFSVGSNQMWCNNYYVHSFGFFSPRTKVYLFFGKKYSGLVIVNFITIKTICTSCRVQLSWELMRP